MKSGVNFDQQFHENLIEEIKEDPTRFLVVYSVMAAFIEDVKDSKDEFVEFLKQETKDVNLNQVGFICDKQDDLKDDGDTYLDYLFVGDKK
jgi:hypothetical protein